MRRAGFAGAAASIVAMAVLITLFPGTAPFILTPGILLLPILGKVIPTSAVYWLVPEGGAPAGLLVVFLGAALLWSLAGAVLGLGVARLARRRELRQL